MVDAWDGKPKSGGWHWLIRKRDSQPRMASYRRFDGFWRVADAAGRTVIISETKVARLYDLGEHVPEPLSLGGTEEQQRQQRAQTALYNETMRTP